ncbi:uracil phosphoribosyltransferase [Arhodomonas sp. AD133]|uniref:uracil phosphoribosyltransferase n=1 Tax=Arhodomonas sp. AD133 TaxID=3415009 RepID=UPI003EBD301C
MQPSVTVIDHPLVQHKLTLLRDRQTSTAKFRDLLREVSVLLAYEVTRDLPLTTCPIETPLAAMDAPILDGKKLCFISILRAGNGLLDGMLELIPAARVGHVGLYRDPQTLQPVEYYYKVPTDMDRRLVVVVDPMLATGHSAAAAVTRLKRDGVTNMRFLCLVASPEGVETFHAEHPDVPLYTAAVDAGLNEKAYIVPGLGDAGDRMYGTK